MTVAVGHVVILTDRDAVQVSTARAQRIAAEVLDTLRRNLPGVADEMLVACAANIAAGFGCYGLDDHEEK